MILAGTALGVTLLVNLPRGAAMFMLGVFVLTYALYSLLRHGPGRVIDPRWAWLAGLCGGITSSLFGAGGPPYAIYLSQRGLTKEQFRPTMGLATMTSISARVAGVALPGVQGAVLVAIHRELLQAAAHDGAAVAGDIVG